MKVTIRDIAALSSLAPLELASYLRSKGWRTESPSSALATKWTLQTADQRNFEVVLPMDTNLGDYAHRVADIVATLETVEERSQLELFSDIKNLNDDVVRVHFNSADSQLDSMSLDDATTALIHLQGLIASIAKPHELSKSQPYYSAKWTPGFSGVWTGLNEASQHYPPAGVVLHECAHGILDVGTGVGGHSLGVNALVAKDQLDCVSEAQNFLRQIRLDLSGNSGATITLRNSVIPALELSAPAMNDSEPFGRQVLTLLASRLAAARNDANHAVITGSAEKLRLTGHSDLYSALDSMTRNVHRFRSISFNFHWSPSRSQKQLVEPNVEFTSSAISALAEVAGRIRRTQFPADGVVKVWDAAGVVHTLDGVGPLWVEDDEIARSARDTLAARQPESDGSSQEFLKSFQRTSRIQFPDSKSSLNPP